MTIEFNANEQLWCEKYRPQLIKDCILPKALREAFEGFVRNQEMPNLILHGGAGMGKTSVAKALCRELGYDWILINTSNDRNIEVLRGTISQFASSASFDSTMKVVILDEADYANPTSLQPALRSAIEDFSKTTRFVFTCNWPQRIIAPLHSRCSMFDYSIPKDEKLPLMAAFMKRVFAILENEKVEYDKKTVAELIKKHFPDFRRVINELQRYASINGKIDEAILKAAKSYNVAELVSYMRSKDFPAMRKWAVENIADKDAIVVYRDIYDNIYDYIEISSIPLAILTIAKYQYQAISSPDPEINFVACMTELMFEVDWKEHT